MGLIVEYTQLYKKTKRCVDFHKDVSYRMMFHKGMSHWMCQKYVSVDFLVEFTITYKKHGDLVNARACQEIIVFPN